MKMVNKKQYRILRGVMEISVPLKDLRGVMTEFSSVSLFNSPLWVLKTQVKKDNRLPQASLNGSLTYSCHAKCAIFVKIIGINLHSHRCLVYGHSFGK